MSNIKKIGVVFIVVIISMLFAVNIFAANTLGVTYTAELNTPVINVSDSEQTVTVTVKSNKTVDLDGIGAEITVPEGLTLKSVSFDSTKTTISTDFNVVSGIGYVTSDNTDGENVTTDTLLIITFTVPANTVAKEYEIEVWLDDITKDWGYTWEDGTTVSTTLTIKEPTPACEHTNTTTAYAPEGSKQHTVIVTCNDCGEPVGTSVVQDCSSEDNDHNCDYCTNTAVEGHTPNDDDGDCTADITCSICNAVTTEGNTSHTGGEATCKNLAKCEVCGTAYGELNANNHKSTYVADGFHPNGDNTTHYQWRACNDCTNKTIEKVNIGNCSGGTATCQAAAVCTECGQSYGDKNPNNHAYGEAVTGWYQIGSDWYYGAKKVCAYNNEHIDHTPVKGLQRVPYNIVLGHAANAEDVAYAESKNQTFVNKETALYLFDANGKLLRTTGIIDDKYYADGIQLWHPGFVTVENELYYFVGDAENGGNKMADGIVYVTRGTGENTYNPGYIWFTAGQVDTTKTQIATIKTNLFYFKNGVCVTGAGLVELEEGKYIFVRSGGQLATGSYWVTEAKANGFVNGGRAYVFGNDGYLVMTDLDKTGIYDNKYYVEGKLTYAGLIKIDGDIYYVNSKGEVVTGKTYYVTKISDELKDQFKSGDKLVFGEDGKMEPVKNGFVAEGGKLYFYVKNHKQCGMGLTQIGNDYYYIRSSGEVQTGYYYITKVNGVEGFAAGDKCYFDENGKFQKNYTAK